MWRNDRDRPDDPRSRELETQRLARDEYDRPRYGSPANDFGQRPAARPWNPNAGAGPVHAGPYPGSAGAWRPNEPLQHQHQYQPQPQPQHQQPPLQNHPAQQPAMRARTLDDVRVHELMTRRVTSVHPSTSVERAARAMEECDCGALPVVGDNGVLVGIVTDRDITVRIVARGRDARNAIVADCMTERVVACYANEAVSECMRQMAQHQVRRIPVVDDRGRVVGILAQGDLARHAGRHPHAEERGALTETVCALSQPPTVPYR